MAKKTCKMDELHVGLSDLLTDYKEEVADKVYRAGRNAIKELERKTIDTAPIGRRAAGDHFRESIATKSEKNSWGRFVHTWYVKAPNYRLTHLLVHGHATRNGGRTKPDPFLRNALKDVFDLHMDDVEELIRRGK